MEKIGRNHFCPCGSGMKYKKCCLNRTTPLTQQIIEASSIRAQKRYEKAFGHKPKLCKHIKIKLSDAITNLANDFLQSTKTRSDYELFLALACVAWNTELYPDNLDTELDRFFEPKEIDALSDIIPNYVATIIKRKKKAYPYNKHYIIDYELLSTPDGLHINVISSFPEEETSML